MMAKSMLRIRAHGISVAAMTRYQRDALWPPRASRPSSSVATSAHELLQGLAGRHLPCFSVPAPSVRVLRSPAELREELLRGARTARRRASLASLYVGNGAAETELFDELIAGQEAAPQRQVSLLIDFHRARRRDALTLPIQLASAPRSRVVLVASPAAPLPASNFSDRRSTGGATYQAPGTDSRSQSLFGGELLPGTLSEVCGVQHVKAAVFDDTVVITGANLSEEYLTNRQDRALLIPSSPRLADFVCGLLEVLAARGHTYCVHGEGLGRAGQSTGWLQPPRACMSSLSEAIQLELSSARRANPPPTSQSVGAGGCWLVPLPQAGAAGVTIESSAVSWLLQRAMLGMDTHGGEARPLPLMLSSPYLNLPRQYRAALLQPWCGRSRSQVGPVPPTVLSAAPRASGFYGAHGVRSLIPQVYAVLEEQLAGAATARSVPLRRLHYCRRGWTYHAKGLWVWPPESCWTEEHRTAEQQHEHGRLCPQDAPILTVLGSSNLSHRSVHRDIEFSIGLVTTDPSLRDQLQQEQARLQACSRDVSTDMTCHNQPEEHTSLAARVGATFLRTFF